MRKLFPLSNTTKVLMRHFPTLFILILLGFKGLNIQSQEDYLQLRSSAFFSNETENKLALNFTNSLEVFVYVDGQMITSLVDTDTEASRIVDLAWNSTGEFLAALVSSHTRASDHWLIWELNTRELIHRGNLERSGMLEWHPIDPYRLSVASGVRIYDINLTSGISNELSRTFDGIAEIAWNPSGSQLAVLEYGGRLYLLSATDFSVDFRIDENVPLPEREDFYFSFTWSPDDSRFAVYDMLDTEIEVWDTTTYSLETTFPSFDSRLEHAEGIFWTSVGIIGQVDTNDIGLYSPHDGSVINLINQERTAFFWDKHEQQFVYIPLLTSVEDLSLEILPLFPL
jgi:hypothetical protein